MVNGADGPRRGNRKLKGRMHARRSCACPFLGTLPLLGFAGVMAWSVIRRAPSPLCRIVRTRPEVPAARSACKAQLDPSNRCLRGSSLAHAPRRSRPHPVAIRLSPAVALGPSLSGGDPALCGARRMCGPDLACDPSVIHVGTSAAMLRAAAQRRQGPGAPGRQGSPGSTIRGSSWPLHMGWPSEHCRSAADSPRRSHPRIHTPDSDGPPSSFAR